MDQRSETKVLAGPALFWWRLTVGAVVVIPILGVVGAAAWLWDRVLKPGDIVAFVAMYVLTGLGISVGYHRLFTHLSFRAHRGVRLALAILGAMAIEGPIIRWVADHRRHHRFTDRMGDPHSPHVRDPHRHPWWSMAGLYYAHVGWFFDAQKTRAGRYVPDLLRDPTVRWVDSLYPLWAAISLAIPAGAGWWVHRSAQGAVTGLLFGGLCRIFLVQHVTWSINSLCHAFGSQPFSTGDQSRNNALLAFFSFGECWHNNHHAFPASSRLGLQWWQVDVGWYLLVVLERFGLVKRLNTPGPRLVSMRTRLRTTQYSA